MILNREQRKRLFAGEVIELRFPADQPCPVRFDAVYTIETDKRGKDGQKLPSQGHFRVLVVRKRGEEWVAAAKYEGDPVRLLAKVAEYTDYEGRALEGEPEAVDEATQNQQAKDGRKRFEEGKPLELVKRDDKASINRLREEFRQGRSAGRDMRPLRDAINREVAKWREQEAA